MAKFAGKTSSTWKLFILLMAGGIAGSAVGAGLASVFPIGKNFFDIGLRSLGLDLHFFSFNFAFHLAVGPATAAGIILGYFAYRRL